MSIINYYYRLASFIRLKKLEGGCRRAFDSGKTVLDYPPYSINLMMADVCNSQCIMCGHDYKSCGSSRYISLPDIKKIYSNLDIDRVLDVIYGGGGEPFLNPDLPDIAEWTYKHYPVIQHTVISNMLAGSAGVYERLVASRVNILASINAASSAVFARVSGVDGYDKVIANVRRLVEIRNRINRDVNISISMILMKENISELPDFIRLAADLGVDAVKTLYVRVYPAKLRAKNSTDIRISEKSSLFYFQKESDEIIKCAESVARKMGMPFDHEPLFGSSSSLARDCKEAWRSLFVNFDGSVYPCPASEILFKKKVDSGQYQSGNILTQNYSDFWNNSFWQAIRKTNISKGREDIVPECLCCGNAICWAGSDNERSHVLDWSVADKSNVKL